MAARVVFSAGGAPASRSAHAVLVVFADEDDRKFPERRHVDGLEELALARVSRWKGGGAKLEIDEHG